MSRGHSGGPFLPLSSYGAELAAAHGEVTETSDWWYIGYDDAGNQAGSNLEPGSDVVAMGPYPLDHLLSWLEDKAVRGDLLAIPSTSHGVVTVAGEDGEDDSVQITRTSWRPASAWAALGGVDTTDWGGGGGGGAYGGDGGGGATMEPAEWWYRGEDGVIYGPFDKDNMNAWYQAEQFPGDLQVSGAGEEGPFFHIERVVADGWRLHDPSPSPPSSSCYGGGGDEPHSGGSGGGAI